MSKEMKACPFCGGVARTRTTRKMNTNKDMRYYVECKTCYSSSNPWYDLGAKDTKAEAIVTWNTRQDDALKEFARKVIRSLWSGELDELTIQDSAEELGLIVAATVTKADISEYSDLSVGDTMYKFSDILKEQDDG